MWWVVIIKTLFLTIYKDPICEDGWMNIKVVYKSLFLMYRNPFKRGAHPKPHCVVRWLCLTSSTLLVYHWCALSFYCADALRSLHRYSSTPCSVHAIWFCWKKNKGSYWRWFLSGRVGAEIMWWSAEEVISCKRRKKTSDPCWGSTSRLVLTVV